MLIRLSSLAVTVACAMTLAGCGGSTTETSGDPFEPSYHSSSFHPDAAYHSNGCAIDVSEADRGYVAAAARSSARLKLVIQNGPMSYNYDMSNKGSPVVVPLNMGNGTYQVEVMQNTTGNNYVLLASTSANVKLEDELQPFLRPNIYCRYDKKSACVRKAAQLVKGAENQGDAVKAIYTYIVKTIDYDAQKARELENASGYIPDPDETLKTEKGICLDYASLGAAMLRSVGIPCKIVTGYIEPTGSYHAWNMVYLNGTWETVGISVKNKTWSRLDPTYDAAGSTEELKYTDRYTY